MSESRRGLGRGLSALLGEAEEAASSPAAASQAGVREIPIELIRRNPDQPRRHFSEAQIDELAESLRAKGLLQPVLVRPAPGAAGEFQLVAGERRWRAAQKAGLRVLPALVRELDDIAVLEIGVIENVQRADLTPLEEAEAYRALIDRFGRTQEDVAQAVGKSRSHVANTLRLLSLPAEARELLREGSLTAGHARAILAAPDPDALAHEVARRGLSVRDTEALVRKAQEPRGPTGARGARMTGPDADTLALQNDLADTLGVGVEIKDRGGAGTVILTYASLEQLDALCQRLSRTH
jgi:ParB family chromosome partitioning protein